MKNLLKPSFMIAFVATSLIFTGCSDETNDVLVNNDSDEPTTEETYTIVVTPTNADSGERTIEIAAEPNSLVEVDVSFTGDKAMRRIYMTKNVYSEGNGPQAFEYELGSKKNDGSIDLDGDDKESFDFTFIFDAPSSIDDVVQYNIWTTNARGDFRDVSNSNSISDDAYGSITIKGSETTSTIASDLIREFSASITTETELQAPLAQGYSKTFISVLDGATYKIVQQSTTATSVVDGTFTDAEKEENAEYAAYWDFGYFNTNSLGASFSSASYYMNAFTNNGNAIVDITNFTGLTSDDLNKSYFALSTLTTAEFDAATYDTLNLINTPTAQYINNLEINDVVYFEDAYGNKGLIKINNIEGTYNANDYIEFDVKVQVNYEPIKL